VEWRGGDLPMNLQDRTTLVAASTKELAKEIINAFAR
jgi:hypothetical protein